MRRVAIGFLTLVLLAACSPRPTPPNVIPPNITAPADAQGAKPNPARS
jgi:hypothetical protein